MSILRFTTGGLFLGVFMKLEKQWNAGFENVAPFMVRRRLNDEICILGHFRGP